MIGPDPLPAGDLRADALLQAVLAQVRAPRPAHDHDLDGIARGRNSQLAVPVEGDWAQVALRQAVDADELVACRPQLLDAVRKIHVEKACRVLQALEMVCKAKDRRAL